MQENISNKLNELERKRGSANKFLSNPENMKIMDQLLSSMINLVSNYQSISDDMLFLCFEYEQRHKQVYKLLETILNVTRDSLTIPINKFKYQWFILYLLQSSVWYKIININTIKTGNEKISKDPDTTNLKDKMKYRCTCGNTKLELTNMMIRGLGGSTNECHTCEKAIYPWDYYYLCYSQKNDLHMYYSIYAVERDWEYYVMCLSCYVCVDLPVFGLCIDSIMMFYNTASTLFTGQVFEYKQRQRKRIKARIRS